MEDTNDVICHRKCCHSIILYNCMHCNVVITVCLVWQNGVGVRGEVM